MALALKRQWIWDGRSAPFLKADQSGDPELPHMNQETGAIAHG